MDKPISTQWTYDLYETDNGILETGGGFVLQMGKDGKRYRYAVKASHPIENGTHVVTGWGNTPEDALSDARRLACEAERARVAWYLRHGNHR